MVSKFLFAMMTTLLASQAMAWGGPETVDVLKCRTARPVLVQNLEKENVRTDHFLVIQNENRNYATVFVGRKNMGMTSYQRSAKGHQISVMGWDIRLTALLVPEKNSREIAGQRAFTSYAGRLDGTQMPVVCAFERRTLE